MSKLLPWILGAVACSGLLLVAAAFAAGMGAVLDVLGDESAARVALGAGGVSAAGFLIMQFVLVLLLALAFLQKNMDGEAFTDGTPRDRGR